MEPHKQCVLLALALLQVVVLAEDMREGCGSDRTGCRVVSGSDEPTVLECVDKQVPGVTAMNIPATNETFIDSQRKTNISSHEANGMMPVNETGDGTSIRCNINDTACEIISNMTIVINDQREFEYYNINETETANTSESSSHNQGMENEPGGDKWLRLSSVEVNLLGNLSVLDMSTFLSVKSVIINTYGFDILKVCGATGVAALTVTSSSIVDLHFVSYFNNLKYLNLSHNRFKTIPNTGILPSISSMDLSFNNISLKSNYSLPQNLRMLNISFNNMSNTGEFTLKGNVIVLDIRGNRLSCAPIFEMKNLEELYLSHNDILILKEKTFMGLVNLTILDLRANRLNELEEKVFQGLNRLQWLDLSENNLMSLAPATFQYLNNLVTLLLSKNQNLGNLQDIEDASLLFGTGQRLQEIEASGTNLSRIPSTVTRSVRKLFLTDNTICTIQCGEVDSFPLLQEIDVSNNMINDIEEDALGRLEFLSNLFLAGNKLTNIPKSLPNQLQVLDLRCNKIIKLNDIDFLGLQKLRILLLSMNQISVVEDGAFGQLVNLDVLDLSYNPIKTLYRSSFTGPRRLKELYLVSLTDLVPLKEPLSFPAPESSHLEVLNLDASPELATRLMDDVAALTMFHELYELSLRDCRLETLRSDLPRYLPRLHKLGISSNPINCTDIMWLMKWLQSINISMQDEGKTRCNLYNNRFRSCKNIPDQKRLYDENVTCASPEIFLGKTIVSLKEENFPDLRTTQFIPLTTEKPTSAIATEKPTPVLTTVTTTGSVTGYIKMNGSSQDVSLLTTQLMTYSLPTASNSNKFTTELTRLIKNPAKNFNGSYNNTKPKKSRLSKSGNSLNNLQSIWEYSKGQSKYPYSTPEPFIILLNDTKHTLGVTDNQMNDTISSGAFLAHEPPTTHPGMMVFIFVFGVIIVASSAMVYSHCVQLRHSSQYHHHQDIEVSSFGGNELW